MVERILVKSLVGFDEIELEFDDGLVVFTGPSGAGKSLFLSAILGMFGHSADAVPELCEVVLKKPANLSDDAYLLGEEVTLKLLKKEKVRFFIDGQTIAKKRLKTLFSPYVRHLSVRDKTMLTSEMLIEMLDTRLGDKEKDFRKTLREYTKRFRAYEAKRKQYEEMLRQKSERAERIEFLRFEIDKIAGIDPKEEEEEALLSVKRKLSKIDKIKEALAEVEAIFRYETAVERLYALIESDVSYFSDAMNRLRAETEEALSLSEELEEVNVEEVLERLSQLNTLKKRFGSIAEALRYKEEKEAELASLMHIDEDLSTLGQFLSLEARELRILAKRISSARKKEAETMQIELESDLKRLRLQPLRFVFEETDLGENGCDAVSLKMGESTAETLSGGEFNRVRLALLAASVPQGKRKETLLVFDEIDANVSGDESIAVAEMMERLAAHYQVFAISHQPHLSAKASQHIRIYKDEAGVSRAEVLDEKRRIEEIARIVGGESAQEEAVAFATRLRKAAV